MPAGNVPRPTTPEALVVATREPSPQDVKQAVEGLNRAVRSSNSTLEFSTDRATKKLVVEIVDTETGEVIRPIQSDVLPAIVRSIGQFQNALLVDQEEA